MFFHREIREQYLRLNVNIRIKLFIKKKDTNDNPHFKVPTRNHMRLSTLKSLSLILYTFILYGDSKISRKIAIRFRGDFTVCYMAINKNATRQSPRFGVISGSIQTTFCPSIVPKKSKSDPRLQDSKVVG